MIIPPVGSVKEGGFQKVRYQDFRVRSPETERCFQKVLMG